MSRARGWCFTINNYTEDELAHLDVIECRYLCRGLERGEKGTPHIQGVIYWDNPKTLKAAKAEIGARAHLEAMKGTIEEASTYCKKDGNFTERGEKPTQGKRTDLTRIRETIQQGGGMATVMDLCDNYQQAKYAEMYLKYKEPGRTWKPNVTWLWGETGAGKTRLATEMAAGRRTWISARNLKWWEGYDGHEVVIIDDFRKDFCTFHELLRILDRYEYRVETKGSSRQLLAKDIIITSCYPPESVYDTREDVGQLLRRIDAIRRLNVDTEVGGNTGPDLCAEKNETDNIGDLPAILKCKIVGDDECSIGGRCVQILGVEVPIANSGKLPCGRIEKPTLLSNNANTDTTGCCTGILWDPNVPFPGLVEIECFHSLILKDLVETREGA